MNIAYQLDRHAAAQLAQWPHLDERTLRRRILRSLRTGQAWLWPEPQQLTLF